jgi:hypothetical protein
MSRALAGLATIRPSVRAKITSGHWTLYRDRHLARLRPAIADLDARLLVAKATPSLSDRVGDVLLCLWRWTLEDASLIRALIIRGRRARITTLLAVIREAHADGPVRDLVKPFARDLIQREAMEDGVAAARDGAGG